MEAEENRSKKTAPNLLQDDRFKALFENPEFQVDKNADEYKMLTPVLSRLDKRQVKELKRKAQAAFIQADEEDAKSSGDEDLFDESAEDDEEMSSDDDDRTWTKEVKKQYRDIRKQHKAKDRQEEDEEGDSDGEEDRGDYPNGSNKPSKAAKMLEVSTTEFKVKNLRTKTNK